MEIAPSPAGIFFISMSLLLFYVALGCLYGAFAKSVVTVIIAQPDPKNPAAAIHQIIERDRAFQRVSTLSICTGIVGGPTTGLTIWILFDLELIMSIVCSGVILTAVAFIATCIMIRREAKKRVVTQT